ncbi:integrase domain-containing protein [Paraburkholderia xenovorans]|uniref:integrase domain-containing protein n=1 Tax=Paraburkholderia xenovorans TaxID=36873 RepID=UPI0038B9B3D1
MAKNERGFDERPGNTSSGSVGEPKGWKAELQDIIDANVHKRANNRQASHRTKELNARVLFAIFKTLHHKLNRPIHPRNLAEAHIKLLAQYWYTENKAPATMRNELSVLRKFSRWIGKPNLAKPLQYYLPDASPERVKPKAVADATRSWSGNRIDVEVKLREAFEIDDRFGMIIAMQLAFGLRKKEACSFQPWVSDQRDLGRAAIIVCDGSKGGRQRIIPIEFPFQIVVLDYVKQCIGKRDRLGWKKTIRGLNANLERNLKRYDYHMGKLCILKADCSVCGHGLRAEYAENCALFEGFVPTMLGGKGDEFDADEMRNRKKRVSERLGHSRVQVTGSYFGPTPPNAKKAADIAAAPPVSLAPEDEMRVSASDDVQRTGGKPVAEAQGLCGADLVTDSVRSDASRATPAGSGLLQAYYVNAPARRKHPDNLATTPAQEWLKKAEEKARAREVERADGQPNAASDWEKPAGRAKAPKLEEHQLRLPQERSR